MKNCQHQLLLILLCAYNVIVYASANAEPEAARRHEEQPQFVVITEDVIPDVENTTQKVIRVNPLELPSKNDATGSMDSSLYNIQSLLPANHRKYINSNRMRRPRPSVAAALAAAASTRSNEFADSPILRHLPAAKVLKPKHQMKEQKKKLHFLYDQADIGGHPISKTMDVRFAPGAYPVYYAVSKSNGRFGKHPIKGFRNQEDFMKYLLKSKLATVELTQSFDS